MTDFAPPVRRSNFIYHSILYADPGNGQRHSRASVAELAALLRPDGPTSAKDQVWHYYSAQLVHYGLPATKDKNGAKMRLLHALNNFKLEVPDWVRKQESEMKQEWEAENRKLKRTADAKSKSVMPVRAEGGRDGFNSGPRSINNGGVNVMVNLSLSSASVGNFLPNTPTKTVAAKRKRANNEEHSPLRTPKKAAKTTKVSALSKPTTENKKTTPKTVSRVNSKPRPHNAPSPTPSRPQSIQQHTSSPIKPDPYLHSILLSGTYTITCPTATSLFHTPSLDLSLAKDPRHNIWWATFRWGDWDGIMQLNLGPQGIEDLGRLFTFGWRLRDLQSGRLDFGSGCMGDVTFYRGEIEGRLFNVPGEGMVEFHGVRMEGEPVEDDLEHEWDAFVDEAYGC
ncbi:hypothetical protein N0V94_003437 [Neodidymelliopsis sp. IMI 364377]|nr:hypothetical protein N0V94_003437 [Neodidymelliopsis sp. IMI 364377]